jgi:LysR family transcriptional regulator, carnitine catabolism transcriptional activator
MNVTQRQLQLFVAAAATLNITRASEVVHLSQPAFTRALRAFEAQLGVALFHRSTRRLALTADGRRFLPVAQRLLGDLAHAVAGIRSPRAGLGGTVEIATGTAFACTVLPPVLRQFTRAHPDVRVRLRDDNSEGVTSRVERGEVAFGIASVVGNAGGLATRRLLSAPLGLLAHPAHHRLPARPALARLAALPLIKEADDTSIMTLLRQHGSALVAAMERGIEVSSLAVQLALVRAGAGVAVLSALGASHPEARGLAFVALSPALRREVFMIHRRDRPLRAPAQALADAIDAALPGAPLHAAVRIEHP